MGRRFAGVASNPAQIHHLPETFPPIASSQDDVFCPARRGQGDAQTTLFLSHIGAQVRHFLCHLQRSMWWIFTKTLRLSLHLTAASCELAAVVVISANMLRFTAVSPHKQLTPLNTLVSLIFPPTQLENDPAIAAARQIA